MAAKTKKSTKKVVVQDNTETPEVSPGEALRAQIEAMSDEERKAAGLKVLKQKAPEGPSQQDKFNEAEEDFKENVLPNIQEMLDGCNFPGAYMLQIGVTNEGKFIGTAKRVRKPYAARKEASTEATS